MRKDVATARDVVSKARELLARSKNRTNQETLRAIIVIFDAHANHPQAGEPRNDYGMDPGPAGFDFSDIHNEDGR